MRCPYCGSVVEPMRDVQGALVCPACRNTGRVAFAQPTWAPVAATGFAPPPLPPPGVTPTLAIVSLVLGVVSIVMVFTFFLAPLAAVFGGVAIGLGIPPLRRGRSPPVSSAGRGLAVAGIVTGAIGVVIGLVAAVAFGAVFSVLDDLGDLETEPEPYIVFDRNGLGPGGTLTVVDVDSGVDWEDLEVSGTASCSAPSGSVRAGDQIACEVDGRVEVLHWPSGEVVYSTTL
jgi:hypothetical protein